MQDRLLIGAILKNNSRNDCWPSVAAARFEAASCCLPSDLTGKQTSSFSANFDDLDDVSRK